jgi:hypothetical protein
VGGWYVVCGATFGFGVTFACLTARSCFFHWWLHRVLRDISYALKACGCILRFGSRCVEDGSGYHSHGPDLWALHTYTRQGNRTYGSGYRSKLVATRLETDSRQGVTARPGARFGPSGIRRGSRRIAPEVAWSIYTGMYSSVCSVLRVRVASIATRVQPVITLHAIRSLMHGHSAASVAQSGLREAVSHAYVE